MDSMIPQIRLQNQNQSQTDNHTYSNTSSHLNETTTNLNHSNIERASSTKETLEASNSEKFNMASPERAERTPFEKEAVRKSMATRHGHREIRFGTYVLGSTLGEGEFGKVKLGWRKDGHHPSQVAIKLIKRDTLARDTESEVKIHREINLMRLLSHPNIVNLVEVLKSGKYIGIVLEYASGGELFEYILQHKHLKEHVAKRLFAQLVSGVDYMHLKGLIHRDLKLENLLLDKHKNIIISDFGFVNSYNRAKNDLMKTSCGLPCYAAPELVLTRSPYSGRKVDIWSMGVILYAMLAGYLPFDDDVENEGGADIFRLYNYICSSRLTFPEYVSPLARDLLRRIIVPDPKKRIGIDEIRYHPWLALHASLLTIRQPEWDRMANEEKLGGVTASVARNCGQSRNKRFSLIAEPTNSSALMLNGSKRSYGKSYASSSNIIYSNPTTSSSIANAVGKTEGQVRLAQISGIDNDLFNQSSSYSFQKGHIKSASTSHTSASTVLKAVVSEHAHEVLQSQSRVQGQSQSVLNIHATNQPPSTSIQQSQKSTLQNLVPIQIPNVSRTSTYSGTIPTIAESASAEVSRIPRAIPTERLPHTQKRPRPTSYHPGSMSLSFVLYNNSALTVGDYVAQAYNPYLHSLSSPTRVQDSALSISEKSSPVLTAAPPQTRRDSVLTAINVNGVLSDSAAHDPERNSVLSYLEEKMDALELCELHSPVRIPLDDLDLLMIPNTPQISKLQVELPQQNKSTPVLDHLPSFSAADSPTVIIVKEEENESPKVNKAVKMEPEKEKGKENVVQESKRRNRFSILSFYDGSYFSKETEEVPRTTETNGMDNTSKEGTSKEIVCKEGTSKEGISKEGASKESGKKEKRMDSAGSAPLRRRPMSMISPSMAPVTTKEASAARKLMNFFKRRTTRIG